MKEEIKHALCSCRGKNHYFRLNIYNDNEVFILTDKYDKSISLSLEEIDDYFYYKNKDEKSVTVSYFNDCGLVQDEFLTKIEMEVKVDFVKELEKL